MAESAFYTLSEAAKALGVHYETAARWVRSGRLPAGRFSRRKILVPKQSCRALLKVRRGGAALAGKAPMTPFEQWMPWIGILTAEEGAQLRALIEERFEKIEED